MSASSSLSAGVLIIGNEILSGRTHDLNLPFLGKRLHQLGITIAEARIIPDDEAIIAQHVLEFHQQYTYVFTTGGIGPTHDDITSQSVAKAFQRPLTSNPAAVALLQKRCGSATLNDHQLKMALVPEGAQLINNPVTGAPGFRIENVFVFAGVPKIMQAMFDSILPQLQTGKPFVTMSVQCYLGEGKLATGLNEIQNLNPEVDIGSYPFWGVDRHGSCLVVRAQDKAAVKQVHQQIIQLIESFGATPFDIEDSELT